LLNSVNRWRGAKAQAVLEKADFQHEIQCRMRALTPEIQVSVVGEFEILMRNAGGDEQTLYLHNAFHAYQNEGPDRRNEVIDRYVRSYLASGYSEEATLDALIPMVKSKAWLSDMEDALIHAKGGASVGFFRERLNDELFVIYAINSAQSIHYVDDDQIAGFGLPHNELRALAVRNLRGFVPGITIERGPLVSMVVAGGDFEASLILFSDLWERERARMQGSPVFSIPARDLLLFTDSADEQGVEKLKTLAADMNAKATYPLSDALFVVNEGHFELFPR
ncbi:MAG: DUF1444 family protein, partial [Pseudoxanthomonas sp.]